MNLLSLVCSFVPDVRIRADERGIFDNVLGKVSQVVYMYMHISVTTHQKVFNFMRGSRGGNRGSGPPLKNHKNIGFLSNTGPDSLKFTKKSQSYQVSIQCWAISGTPANRHLNDVLLAGQRWPAFSGIWVLPSLKEKKKRKNTLSEL